MKKTLLIISMALLTAMSAWADVQINETNFPDENFRNWVLSQDYGADGMLTDVEIKGINRLYIGGKEEIKSLKGIEYFSALNVLYCTHHQLTELDVSKNTNLEELNCSGNQLTSLDVSKNIWLRSLDCNNNQLASLNVSNNAWLSTLYSYVNQLTELDVSNCPALTELTCDDNRLTSLDLSNNTQLTLLACGGNPLKTIDVSKNIALSSLACNGNQLTTIDVSNNTNLESLLCFGNQLTSLDVSNNKKLWRLYCFRNQIKGTAMDALLESLPTVKNGMFFVKYYENEQNVMTVNQVAVAKAKGWIPYCCTEGRMELGTEKWQEYAGSEPVEDIAINATNFPDRYFRNYLLSQEYGKDGKLTEEEIAGITSIILRGSGISSMEGIEYFTALRELDCYGGPFDYGKLSKLDLSKNTALEKLLCMKNQLTELNVSGCKALRFLDCKANQLTALDVSKNTALTFIDCCLNQLTALDVTNNVALDTLNCSSNQITALDLSKNGPLTYLDCNGNPLMVLDVTNNPALKIMYCCRNQLSVLDVSKNTALEFLNCWNNQLTSLDVSGCTVLKDLQCDDNQLTSLDVSNNTALTSLLCGSNQLSTFDISKNTALISLTCSYNQLTSLNVSGFTGLTRLYCHVNQLTSLNVSGCTALTNLDCYQNQLKGSAMDALVESLPTISNGKLYAISDENEQNVMTKAQVAAAKAKGWDTYSFNGSNYQEYEGSEPEPVVIAEETTVNPSENAEPGQATTTESGVTTSLGDEDVVDAAEGNVTIVSSMTNDAVKELIETTQPGSSYFNETFKGFYFLLAAGKGKVEFDIETSGGYSLGVMKGSELVGVYTQSTKGTVTIPYDLEEDTWFFAYPVVNTPAAANRAAGDGALKVYGLRIIPEESGTPDGINNLAPAFAKGNGVVYNLQGQRTDGLQKGLNIVDGKKVWVK